MLIYSDKYRGWGKQKPRQWGPISAVRSAGQDYYENRLGADFSKVSTFFPLWERAGIPKCLIQGGEASAFTGGWVGDGISSTENLTVRSPAFNMYTYGTDPCYTLVLSGGLFYPRYLKESLCDVSYTWDAEYLRGATEHSGAYSVQITNRFSGSPVYAYCENSTVRYGYTTALNQLSIVGKNRDTVELYEDAELVDSKNVSNITFVPASSPNWCVLVGASSSSAIQRLGSILFTREALSATQLALLHDAPYAAIQPRVAPVYFFPAGGGETITVSAAGAIAISGFNPSISTGTTVSSTVGQIAIAGLNASVSTGVSFSASAGSIVISGFDAAVSQGVSFDADLGAVSITSFNNEVSQTVNVNVLLAEALIIAGFNAQVSCGVAFSVTSGSVSIATFQAQVSNQLTVDCSFGTVSVAGYNPEVLAGTSIDTTLGQVSVSGSQATVSSGTSFETTQGSVSVAGYNPEISMGVLIEPTTGLVTIVGLESSVSATSEGVSVSCTAGTIAIAGLSCSVYLLSTPATRTNTIVYEDRTNTITA